MEHLDRFVFHQFLKLHEVDLAVTIQVGLLDHRDHLLLTEGLAKVVHRDHQLLLGDQPVTVPVEHPENRRKKLYCKFKLVEINKYKLLIKKIQQVQMGSKRD